MHPDWTKEDVEHLREEIRAFEDDMELLREEEEEEDDADVHLKDANEKGEILFEGTQGNAK